MPYFNTRFQGSRPVVPGQGRADAMEQFLAGLGGGVQRGGALLAQNTMQSELERRKAERDLVDLATQLGMGRQGEEPLDALRSRLAGEQGRRQGLAELRQGLRAVGELPEVPHVDPSGGQLMEPSEPPLASLTTGAPPAPTMNFAPMPIDQDLREARASRGEAGALSIGKRFGMTEAESIGALRREKAPPPPKPAKPMDRSATLERVARMLARYGSKMTEENKAAIIRRMLPDATPGEVAALMAARGAPPRPRAGRAGPDRRAQLDRYAAGLDARLPQAEKERRIALKADQLDLGPDDVAVAAGMRGKTPSRPPARRESVPPKWTAAAKARTGVGSIKTYLQLLGFAPDEAEQWKAWFSGQGQQQGSAEPSPTGPYATYDDYLAAHDAWSAGQ